MIKEIIQFLPRYLSSPPPGPITDHHRGRVHHRRPRREVFRGARPPPRLRVQHQPQARRRGELSCISCCAAFSLVLLMERGTYFPEPAAGSVALREGSNGRDNGLAATRFTAIKGSSVILRSTMASQTTDSLTGPACASPEGQIRR